MTIRISRTTQMPASAQNGASLTGESYQMTWITARIKLRGQSLDVRWKKGAIEGTGAQAVMDLANLYEGRHLARAGVFIGTTHQHLSNPSTTIALIQMLDPWAEIESDIEPYDASKDPPGTIY